MSLPNMKVLWWNCCFARLDLAFFRYLDRIKVIKSSNTDATCNMSTMGNVTRKNTCQRMLEWLVLNHPSFMCKPSNFPQVTWTPGSQIDEELTKLLTCNIMPTTIRHHLTAFGSTIFTICQIKAVFLNTPQLRSAAKALNSMWLRKGAFHEFFYAWQLFEINLYCLGEEERQEWHDHGRAARHFPCHPLVKLLVVLRLGILALWNSQR